MRICTYNIWNHENNYDLRMNMLIDLFKTKNIDVFMLQEVRDDLVVLKIKEACNFQYYYWKEYFDCKEDLAILSRYELTDNWTNWDENEDVHNSGSMGAIIDVDGNKLSIVNVHLDYRYSLNREIELIKALSYHENSHAKYKIIAGDFNTYAESRIYRYLTGLESMSGKSARWIDLVEAYCIRHHIEADVTIDFINNPRWKDEPCLEKPGRFDWMMLENPYPSEYPKVVDYELIGKEAIDDVTPSDHYGVLVDIEL